ncbi:phage tail tape measure protein [Flavilitoribacter nigricans]|uniref:Uncharacterized protein n=1 Tax=Flavilitoribacter nigricans (strain ATCC 23147 / DSM 23189 / NBRC 102662 / NCIMB 1420 / SS-2) TaxID=1122177 RepID=A0A2D0MY23_FLAN2|nr:hypothetical protein [Flavilitoribacter nigricans]PHN01145.1 hypothetical protein CRP01_38730 [Flavilitoribacter nigricans DSM 23189 = NBRC 102662]
MFLYVTLSIVVIAALWGSWKTWSLFKKYQDRIQYLTPEFYDIEHPAIKEIISQIEAYDENVELAQEIEKNANDLSFPEPPVPDETATEWLENYRILTDTFNDKSFISSISNNGLFQVIPPPKLFKLIRGCSLIIKKEGSEALDQSYEAITNEFIDKLDELTEEGLNETAELFLREVLDYYSKIPEEKLKVFIFALKIEPLDTFLEDLSQSDIILNTLNGIVDSEELREKVAIVFKEHMESAKEEIKELVSDVFDVDSLPYIPVFTIIVATIQEAELLMDGNSSIAKSAQRIAAKTGIKVVAATTGAVIGTALAGPIGGAVLSAAFSALGKFAFKRFENRHIRKAKKDYKELFNEIESNCKIAVNNTIFSIRGMAQLKKKMFYDEIGSIPIEDPAQIDSYVGALRSSYKKDMELSLKTLLNAKKNIFYWVPVNKTRIDFAIGMVSKNLEKIEKISSNREGLQRMFELPVVVNGNYDRSLVRISQQLKELNADFVDSIIYWSIKTTFFYRQTISEIATEANNQMKSFQKLVDDYKQDLEAAERRVRKLESLKKGKKKRK